MDSFHEKLTQFLAGSLTEARRQRIDEIIDHRTRFLTVVLEDVYKEHNASAVVRTCECLGLQDLHIIENHHKYNVNPNVVMGSSKWIDAAGLAPAAQTRGPSGAAYRLGQRTEADGGGEGRARPSPASRAHVRPVRSARDGAVNLGLMMEPAAGSWVTSCPSWRPYASTGQRHPSGACRL